MNTNVNDRTTKFSNNRAKVVRRVLHVIDRGRLSLVNVVALLAAPRDAAVRAWAGPIDASAYARDAVSPSHVGRAACEAGVALKPVLQAHKPY